MRVGITIFITWKLVGTTVSLLAKLPITVDKAAGISAADITLTYDPKILTAVDVTKGSLTSDCYFADKIHDGEVRIAFAMATDLAAKGTMAEITFKVSPGAPPGASRQLDLSVSMNDGLIGASPVSGKYTNSVAVTNPTEYNLLSNYPNPFNASTTIHYAIASREQRAKR